VNLLLNLILIGTLLYPLAAPIAMAVLANRAQDGLLKVFVDPIVEGTVGVAVDMIEKL